MASGGIQERFDELAKGLATNQLSRGLVIMGFLAGVLLAGTLGALWRSSRFSAQHPATGPTALPCAIDPVTSAALEAAGSALATGAAKLKLSLKGCELYRRNLKGGSVTSEEVT